MSKILRYTLKNNDGYTLIELLSVAALLVVITTIIAGVITVTLRATNKTKISSSVSQNGNYALSVISSIIISSKNVLNVGGSVISDCTASPQGSSITFSRQDGGTTVLSCQGSPYTISSNSASLIDTQSVSVKSNSCTFKCSQPNGDRYSTPIIEISFTLQDKGTSILQENTLSTDFNTSMTLRSYNP